MTVELEIEVTVGQYKYRIGRMSVFEQMDIATDYRDILSGLALIKRDRPKNMSDVDFIQGCEFLMTSRAGMTPEVRHRVYNTCMSHISRHSGVGWQRLLASDGVVQFSDIDPHDFIKLLYLTFEHNRLLDFFLGSPSTLDGQTMATDGQDLRVAKTG